MDQLTDLKAILHSKRANLYYLQLIGSPPHRRLRNVQKALIERILRMFPWEKSASYARVFKGTTF